MVLIDYQELDDETHVTNGVTNGVGIKNFKFKIYFYVKRG